MKKWLRPVLILIVFALLAGAWTWRYVTLNKYYDDLDNSDYKLYQSGENVPFEDDGNDTDTDLNGYWVRVDGYEIQEDDTGNSDKLILVHITLSNESCDPNPISLIDFKLRGTDTQLNMDWDILIRENPCLGGYTSIALNAGTEQKLVLPYMLRREDFADSTWEAIEDYPLFLQVASGLTQKEIVVSS